jgi:hypothetical protein
MNDCVSVISVNIVCYAINLILLVLSLLRVAGWDGGPPRAPSAAAHRTHWRRAALHIYGPPTAAASEPG